MEIRASSNINSPVTEYRTERHSDGIKFIVELFVPYVIADKDDNPHIPDEVWSLFTGENGKERIINRQVSMGYELDNGELDDCIAPEVHLPEEEG